LKSWGVELARRIDAVGGLEFLQCGDGAGIPSAVRVALIIAAASERGLNFGDAIRRGRLLHVLARRTPFLPGLLMGR
jgi:hypothetical protein